MPSFNFLPKFAPMVEQGIKTQTIRRVRKHQPRPGQTAYLFAGMRTGKCRRLGAHPITSVQSFHISGDEECFVDGEMMEPDQVEALALADGFQGAEKFLSFFRERYGLPFDGDLIKWSVEKGQC